VSFIVEFKRGRRLMCSGRGGEVNVFVRIVSRILKEKRVDCRLDFS
jgi:hypothetical protein